MKKRDIERIKGIKERVDRTTPGKWMVEKYYHDEPYEEYIKSAAVVTKHSTITRNDWSNPVEADLDFIANARQDIPYLLDKIDELYALNRELTELIARNLVAWDTSKDKREGLLPEVYLSNKVMYKQLTGEEYVLSKAIKRFNIL